jgi:type IV pilus assembly protein PilA
VKKCPYCAEAIQDDTPQCPFCNTNLGTPTVVPGAQAPSIPGAAPTSGKAIASLICGLFFFVLPSSIVAVILGHLSLSEIKRSAGRLGGRGMAIAGLVLGYAGLSFIPILIIAAIAIPNLLRAKMAANEASAVGSLRSYSYAMGAYSAKCPKIGFPRSLANLGPGRGDCEQAELLDNSLGTSTPIKSGYAFHYMTGEQDNLGQTTSFEITADPITQGTTGLRHFYIDQTEVVRWSRTGPADAESPRLP